MKADLLEEEFRPRTVDGRARALLLRPNDAIELVNRAADEGVPILAVQGLADSPARHPVDEDTADFTPAVGQGHGCWEAADQFIRTRSARGLVFSIALGDDPIQAV
jgi:hypothetical protein